MYKFILTFALFIFSSTLHSQQEFIATEEILEVYENQPIRIKLDIIQDYEIQQAFLFYKTFGRTEFSVVDMNIQGNTISATIPSDYVLFPYVEYYIKVLTTKGVVLNYPFNVGKIGNYYRVNVKKKEEEDEKIIILSPGAEEPVIKEEFFLAISLLRTSKKVKKEFTRVWINDDEVTPLLNFNYDLIFLSPGVFKKLITGLNNIKIVLYDVGGRPQSISNYSFQVVDKVTTEIVKAPKFKFNGLTRVESNYEEMRTGSFNFNRINVRFTGNYGKMNSALNLFATDEERRNVQPQNRFLLSFEIEPVRLYVGDYYPVFPSLIMSGKRLRGISGNMEFGLFNLQVSYGEITRKVEGKLLQLFSRDSVIMGSDIIPVDSTKYGMPFARVNPGSFQRKLFAIRPYFGSGKYFQLGFTYLHSKDNMTSIDFGARPKENVVIGSDLLIGIDQQRILLKAQGAFSLVNNDISIGNFTDEIIDSLFGSGRPLGGDPELIKKIRDVGKNFITINQFIAPLNPQQLATLAGEITFSMNYFGNYFKTSYIYRGNDYASFGQNFLRNDIKGFQIIDRVGLFENRVFLSVSFEQLSDNLQKTKITTTNYQNFESSISLYLRKDFPNITIGYLNYRVKNDIDPLSADSVRMLSYLNDQTHQISFSTNYDLRLNILHRIFINVITSNKKDFTHRKLDAEFLSVNFSLQNFWRKNLSTFIGSAILSSGISTSRYNYYSFNAGTRFNSFQERLKTTFSINPSFGNLKRTIFDFFNQYYIRQNLSINLNVRYILNTKPVRNESIFNFVAQYEF